MRVCNCGDYFGYFVSDAGDVNIDGLPDGMDPLPLQVKFNLNAPYKGSQIGDQSGVQ